MSIQHFPRIPKITLRTPCDQAKDAKKKKKKLPTGKFFQKKKKKKKKKRLSTY